MISKQLRAQIHDKFGGRCAYCGKALNGVFHVDHIVPVRRFGNGKIERQRIKARTTIDQVHPACRRCNNYKNVLSLEDFRIEITQQVERARRYSLNFRLAEDFGLIKEIEKDVQFFFETV